MARQAPQGLLGIHVNLPAAVPTDIAKALNAGRPAPAGLSDRERAAFNSLEVFFNKRRGYSVLMATRPQTIGYLPADSRAGLAAWARRTHRNLIYFHEADKGGHFAAWEQPELFSQELRAAFRPLQT